MHERMIVLGRFMFNILHGTLGVEVGVGVSFNRMRRFYHFARF